MAFKTGINLIMTGKERFSFAFYSSITGIFDVPGVSQHTLASNMGRNRICCTEILNIENTISDHIRGY